MDLTHIELDPRLPSPFTPSGARPTGPAWYQTHTVAYAQELGYNVAPIEAYLRRETGAYLGPWHDRLKTAYVDTLADLGVSKDLTDTEFLAAMERHKQVDPPLAAVLAAIKATVKGGVGKLRERPQGRHYKQGERWPALERPTWRPDIRAAVISKARVNMHRKLRQHGPNDGPVPARCAVRLRRLPLTRGLAAGLPSLRRLRQAAAGRLPPRPHAGPGQVGGRPGDGLGGGPDGEGPTTRPATSRAATPSWTESKAMGEIEDSASSAPTGKRSPASRRRP